MTDPDVESNARTTKVPSISIGPWATESMVATVQSGGGNVVDLSEADALVWEEDAPAGFLERLPERVRWVHLPSAGVENWIASGVIDDKRVWTSAAGAHGRAVAEHALMLLLAGVHALPTHLSARSWREGNDWGRVGALRGSVVGIVGGGGIGRALAPLLSALGAEVVFATRTGKHVPGARETFSREQMGEFWPNVDHVVLAAPATSESRGMVGARELRSMRRGAWLVNVARGSLVNTDALVDALAAGQLGGAALDVTDPEPLPNGHALWGHPRVIITPHIANPQGAFGDAFASRLRENVKRFADGHALLGRVEVDRGY